MEVEDRQLLVARGIHMSETHAGHVRHQPRQQDFSKCHLPVDMGFLQVFMPGPGLAQGSGGAVPVSLEGLSQAREMEVAHITCVRLLGSPSSTRTGRFP